MSQSENNIEALQYFEEDKIDNDLLCVICHEPLFIPVSNTRCGHTFCKACIKNIQKCPICRSTVTDSEFIDSPVYMRKLVNSLKVYCPRCNEIKERGSLNDHLKKCSLLCALGCGMLISLSDQQSHELNECVNTIVKCAGSDVYCDWIGKRSEQLEHERKCVFLAQCKIIYILKHKIEEQSLLIGIQNSEIKALKSQVNKLINEVETLKEKNTKSIIVGSKDAEEAEFAGKSEKKAIIAKSSLILDIKPWDDETDLVEMERLVRNVTTKGLTWGASKLVIVAYGIKKLQIMATIVDDLVSIEDIQDQIQAFNEYVQSTDIVTFNKNYIL